MIRGSQRNTTDYATAGGELGPTSHEAPESQFPSPTQSNELRSALVLPTDPLPARVFVAMGPYWRGIIIAFAALAFACQGRTLPISISLTPPHVASAKGLSPP